MAQGSRLVAIATILMAAASAAEAQRLPVRHYGLAEGLPHNTVTSIYQDRKGFLWIGTFEGLARFDGYRFVSYSTVDGLGHDLVNDIAEDRGGRLWVATNGGGVARLGDGGNGPFVPVRVGPSPLSNAVNAIAFDAANALWCATDDGLYRAVDPDAATPAFEAVARFASAVVTSVFVDSRHRVWTWAPADGLRHLDAERQTWIATEMPRSRRVKISGDRRGRLLLASEGGVFELGGTDATSDRWRPVALPGGALPSAIAALQDARDTLWIATAAGIMRSDAGHTRHGADDGLPPDPSRLLEDRDGNVWIGSSGSGLYRVLTTTIVNIAEVDGRPLTGVTGVFESLDGRIYARLAGHAVVEVTGTRATSPARPVPANQRWAGRRIVRSRTGDWWVVGRNGICRMRGPGFEPDRPAQCQRVPAGAVLAQSTDTLDIPELYEDPQGRIWFGAAGRLWWLMPAGTDRGIWNPCRSISGPPSTSVPALVPALADRSGSLWLLSHEFVVRVAGGRAETIRAAEGVTPVQPRSVFLDSKGRLWIGTRYGGVAMTPQPEATALRFVTYTTQHGLSSNAVWSIAEDHPGRIYFGTGRGLDHLDPSTGAFRHFTIADGLAGDIINQCIADRQGAVWVATPTGLSRLMPDDHEATAAAPLTYLTRIQIVGDDVRVAETGARQGPALTLAADRNSLLIEYIWRRHSAASIAFTIGPASTGWIVIGRDRRRTRPDLSAPGAGIVSVPGPGDWRRGGSGRAGGVRVHDPATVLAAMVVSDRDRAVDGGTALRRPSAANAAPGCAAYAAQPDRDRSARRHRRGTGTGRDPQRSGAAPDAVGGEPVRRHRHARPHDARLDERHRWRSIREGSRHPSRGADAPVRRQHAGERRHTSGLPGAARFGPRVRCARARSAPSSLLILKEAVTTSPVTPARRR